MTKYRAVGFLFQTLTLVSVATRFEPEIHPHPLKKLINLEFGNVHGPSHQPIISGSHPLYAISS